MRQDGLLIGEEGLLIFDYLHLLLLRFTTDTFLILFTTYWLLRMCARTLGRVGRRSFLLPTFTFYYLLFFLTLGRVGRWSFLLPTFTFYYLPSLFTTYLLFLLLTFTFCYLRFTTHAGRPADWGGREDGAAQQRANRSILADGPGRRRCWCVDCPLSSYYLLPHYHLLAFYHLIPLFTT